MIYALPSYGDSNYYYFPQFDHRYHNMYQFHMSPHNNIDFNNLKAKICRWSLIDLVWYALTWWHTLLLYAAILHLNRKSISSSDAYVFMVTDTSIDSIIFLQISHWNSQLYASILNCFYSNWKWLLNWFYLQTCYYTLHNCIADNLHWSERLRAPSRN